MENTRLIAIDLETACAVEGCKYHGKSICPEGHSLSPWHGRITKIAVHDGSAGHVFDGIDQLRLYLDARLIPHDVVGQNFKFDWLWLAVHGLEIPMERWVGDTQLAAFVLTEKIPDSWLEWYESERKTRGAHHRKAGKHSLKTLAPYFLGVEPFWETEDHDNAEYALKDAEYTARLLPVLEAKLKERGEYDFYKSRQLPWAKMLAQAELRGIEIDMERMEALEADLKTRLIDLKKRLDEQWAEAHEAYFEMQANGLYEKYERMAAKANKPFQIGSRYHMLMSAAVNKLPRQINYKSDQQMAWLLRDHLGYDITSLEGDDTTGREVLERLAEEGHEDVKTYLEWRKTNKILTAFLPTYRELASSSDSQSTKVVHPIYNATGTRTGRLSSERPNAQQVPPALRSLFKAREGYSFVGYDLAAIEPRLIALYTEDPLLYEIVASGTSIHDFNATIFFEHVADCPTAEVKHRFPAERKAAKEIGLALFYGAGANRIRIALQKRGYTKTKSECDQILKRYRNKFEVAFGYKAEITKLFENGGIVPNLFGRPIHIPNPEDAYMQGLNSLIQSSGSDLLTEAAQRANSEFKLRQIDATPLAFVHDYLKVEVRDQHVAEADEIIRRCMTDFEINCALGPVPLEVEGGVSKRWDK